VRSVCVVGSSEDRLRLRLRLSSVPGRARPSPGGAFALRPAVICRVIGFGRALVIIVHNIKRGLSSPSSGRHGHSQKTVLELYQLLRLGMGWAQSDIAPTPQQLRLRPSGSHTSEEPGTVAMAARKTVATSEAGGRHSHQSRQERLAYNQYSFLLPLEVVGPGGSLSTVLIATPHWQDVSRRVS
jgi:hypothetical protein